MRLGACFPDKRRAWSVCQREGRPGIRRQDNYNFFVIGYRTTVRSPGSVLSIAASAKGVSICFIHGASLADPSGLLAGAGKQTRFLRVARADDFDRAEDHR